MSVEVIPCETAAHLIARCPHADALIMWVQPVTADVLAALPHLKVISRLGTGVDSIDVPAANRHGVVVTNVPDANSEEVATHTMGLALAAHRRLPSFDKSVRQGQWHSAPIHGEIRRPSEQTFGVIGYGKIGSRVAKLFDQRCTDLRIHRCPICTDWPVTSARG
ncbi:NAD(P)-dependent oxidoreductase [Rhodococcus jostii]|uniref:NAD(P)-dependent oxidoreductase n=1 Tax=Rhodococcus jostii TaxID=132919 RepID=UPI00364ECC9C